MCVGPPRARCFDRACLARERICRRFAPCRVAVARAEEAARRATARSSGAIAAIVAWSALPKSPDRAAASRELAIEGSRRRGTLCPPVPASVTKRTAIPASSIIAATTRRCFLRVGATSVPRSSVLGARRRAAARLVAASRARSAVPFGRRCWSVLEASTAAPAALSFTRRMSSSIASPSRGVLGADSDATRSSRSGLAGAAGLRSLPGSVAAEPSSSRRAPSVMRPRSRSRAAPADWPARRARRLPQAAPGPLPAVGGAP